MTRRKLLGGCWATKRAQQGGSLLEMTIAMLYYVAAASAAKEESRAAATSEGRMLAMRLVRDVRLMGLFATEDIDGDSNDIDRDVPSIAWSNGIHEPVEYATSTQLVFSCDIDNDSLTETIGLYSNADGIQQDIWEWKRDSVEWGIRNARVIGNNIDGVLFRYYDMDGNEIPQSGPIPMGGYTLTVGQRLRITAIELTIVVRSNNEEQVSHRNYVMLPDGRYWYDNYHREVYRFMVRGRNLNLDAS
ncbi:MAG: hypothetical protein IPP40_06240 [bacterium]|nr:hypothetical protein [bacterium]